ncbi:MAG: cobalamin-binding protein [Dehalococcoidia bacterium]|nr:MAG: cobalamin-binding protein [Dehalococcoidia bacterium]
MSEKLKATNLISVLLICSLIVIAAVVACDNAAPGTITDDKGREVYLERMPQRIVSLAPSITEIMFALNLGHKVVGVTDHCDYPEEAQTKPTVGGYFTTSLEVIIALDPDIVFSDGHDPVCGQLEGLGIPFIVLQPKDLDGLISNIELLGNITGSQQKASELVSDLEERIDAVVATVENAPRPRVFYVYDATDPTKPWTVGPGSFIDALISLAGGENVAAQAHGPWIQFSMEELVNSDPEIIVVNAMMGTAVISPSEIKKIAAWQGMTAVREDRIGVVDGDLVDRPGPRIVEGLEEMAQIIHPELFSD